MLACAAMSRTIALLALLVAPRRPRRTRHHPDLRGGCPRAAGRLEPGPPHLRRAHRGLGLRGSGAGLPQGPSAGRQGRLRRRVGPALHRAGPGEDGDGRDGTDCHAHPGGGGGHLAEGPGDCCQRRSWSRISRTWPSSSSRTPRWGRWGRHWSPGTFAGDATIYSSLAAGVVLTAVGFLVVPNEQLRVRSRAGRVAFQGPPISRWPALDSAWPESEASSVCS